jgi:RNA polymerase sigma factor (TIGR02999 family)
MFPTPAPIWLPNRTTGCPLGFARRPGETSRLPRGKLPTMSEVTLILSAIELGDPHAAEQLLPLVYDELRQLAAQKLAQEKPGQTLDATALVHEAYLRLVGDRQFASRRHFFAAAAEAMRLILIDHARRKATGRHGGGRRRVPLVDVQEVHTSPDELLDLDHALTRFAAQEPAKAALVKLRFFARMSIPEAAAALGISVATAERWWVFARTWLYADLAAAAPEKKPAV